MRQWPVDPRRSSFGFTLIELLIVLFIMGLVTGVALLRLGRNENRPYLLLANDLIQMVALAEEQAMLQGRPLGLHVGKDAFYIVHWDALGDGQKGRWSPLPPHAAHGLGRRIVPNYIEIRLEAASRHDKSNKGPDEDKGRPQVVLFANGDLVPFRLYVGHKGEKPRYVVRGEVDGGLSSQALS